jgi:hypothetical protein
MEERATVRPAKYVGGPLGKLVEGAAAKLDGCGLQIYQGSYIDLVLAAESERGTVALVAGSHLQGFPYFNTEPWDNCLLLVGDTGYTFNGRVHGAALRLDLELDRPAPRGRIRFDGEMRRAGDGLAMRIELEIPVVLSALPTRRLGETYNFLEVDGAVGMTYTPFELSGELGTVRVAGAPLALEHIRGACERGVLRNLKSPDFAIRYDRVGVACPGDDGYGLIHLTSHALHERTMLSEAIDRYLQKSASALMTIERGRLTDGNPHGVYSPPPTDPSVVLFENKVDLGPAVLQRQMIRTHDSTGRPLHGLREIFMAKPDPTHKRTFHLNRTQINVFLVFLILLDVVLSTVALAFPEFWSQSMYGMPYVDPAGLLRRTGALWVAFTLLQAIALFRWQHQPYWLPLIAGVRFTELFSDWTTLIAAQQTTTLATLALLIAPPANLVFGLILIATYKRMQTGAIPDGSFFAKPWS